MIRFKNCEEATKAIKNRFPDLKVIHINHVNFNKDSVSEEFKHLITEKNDEWESLICISKGGLCWIINIYSDNIILGGILDCKNLIDLGTLK